MIQWLKNFIEHPGSTIQGITGGAILVGFFAYMASELHCDWSLFSFPAFVTFMVPFIIGGGAGSTKVAKADGA